MLAVKVPTCRCLAEAYAPFIGLVSLTSLRRCYDDILCPPFLMSNMTLPQIAQHPLLNAHEEQYCAPFAPPPPAPPAALVGDLQILHWLAIGLKRCPLAARSLLMGRTEAEDEEEEPAFVLMREPEAVRLRYVVRMGG